MLRDEIERKPEEQTLIDQLRSDCESVRIGIDLAREFPDVLKQHKADELRRWMERAMQSGVPELKSFAEGLERDWPSVSAAAELPWSNGRAEGHVNRIKLVKRQMYGRANFDLLRIRVLARGP
jgi:transposase